MPSYAAVQIIADSIEKVGSADPEQVAEAMHNTTYETPIGSVAFEENGDLKDFQFVIYTWHADANKTPVEES
jgi:branched-chain amino acid transport system substrate-binding protein